MSERPHASHHNPSHRCIPTRPLLTYRTMALGRAMRLDGGKTRIPFTRVLRPVPEPKSVNSEPCAPPRTSLLWFCHTVRWRIVMRHAWETRKGKKPAPLPSFLAGMSSRHMATDCRVRGFPPIWASNSFKTVRSDEEWIDLWWVNFFILFNVTFQTSDFSRRLLSRSAGGIYANWKKLGKGICDRNGRHLSSGLDQNLIFPCPCPCPCRSPPPSHVNICPGYEISTGSETSRSRSHIFLQVR